MKAMRPSLLPGLIAAARRNMARGASGIRLFELGRRYLDDGERPTLGLLLAGDKAPRHWRTGKAQPFRRLRRQRPKRWQSWPPPVPRRQPADARRGVRASIIPGAPPA
jgi:phenylalanyl-tRNA synthetase beta chain